MTTRRELLRLAGAAAGAAALGTAAACERKIHSAGGGIGVPPAPHDRLVVQTAAGLAVLGGGGTAIPAGPAVLGAGGTRLVRAAAAPARTDVTVHEVGTGRELARTGLRGALQPRVLSPDGRLVALATPDRPSRAGGGSPYRPAGRARTTLVVADDGGERIRLDLPGNLEPEAFTATGDGLFVLDYLPPTAPDRYRVRLVDLAGRRVLPLQTRQKRPVPPGAEEEMHGEGRQAVYHTSRELLFTLYTHQPDHLHTRDLLAGVRPGAPGVHAFVHTLSLREQWAFCIDLPHPFGENPAAGHAIALSADGSRVAVVDATSGTVAYLDPEALTVSDLSGFRPPAGAPGTGGAAAAFVHDGRLVVGAGREVVVLPAPGTGVTVGTTFTGGTGGAHPAVAPGPVAEAAGRGPAVLAVPRPVADGAPVLPDSALAARWSCATPVRGLAVHPTANRVYVGQDGAVVCHDLTSGRVLSRVAVPDLVQLRALATPR